MDKAPRQPLVGSSQRHRAKVSSLKDEKKIEEVNDACFEV